MCHRPEASSRNTGSLLDVRIMVDRKALPVWCSLLQQGFMLEARLGVSLGNVLSEQIGIPREYLEGRVQTIFMDGNAVDSLDKVLVAEGCTVALSAAMPGFVGAAFRKGGFYAAMRSSTTHRHGTGGVTETRGRFTLKLFNFLADELGEFIFMRGILVRSQAFFDFLRRQPESFLLGIRELLLDGARIDLTRALSPVGTQAPPSDPETFFRSLLSPSAPCGVVGIRVTAAQAEGS